MGIYTEECFVCTCDGCSKVYSNYNDFSLFVDKDSLKSDLSDDDWIEAEEKTYCGDCYKIDDYDNIELIKPVN
jgi:hypothetical protein